MAIRSVRSRLADARPPDRWVLAPIVALCMLGMLMIHSITATQAFLNYGSSSYYLLRHLQWLLVGAFALYVFSRIDYHRWRRFSVPMMLVALVALTVVLFAPPSISPYINGANRWLRFGPLQGQPSEFAKLAFVIYAADWLSSKGETVRNLWYGLIPFGIILGLLVGLIILEPDMGTSLVVIAIGGSMFFVAGAHLLQYLGGALISILALAGLIAVESYRLKRLTIFLDPWRDPSGDGYQPIQALLALGSGGIAGLGLGVGRQKFGWLPEARTDSIMAVVGEELGFFGTGLVLVLVLTVAIRGYRVALRSSDPFGALLATGITGWIVFQSLLNVAVITLTVPFTGIPMPFISFGGTSLVVLLAAVGILLNVSRHMREPDPSDERRRARRRNRRSRWAVESEVGV
ncbi:MAG: putative lipid II flippase FtsW [Chloroflexota bacterium]|nr:putative lipid II flippase FtsW [Chloroflexota bacterium]